LWPGKAPLDLNTGPVFWTSKKVKAPSLLAPPTYEEYIMPATKTTAPQATAQAAPAPATATAQRVKKERITLEFSDVHEAFEVLSVLCLHVQGLYDDLNHHGWSSARTANTIAIAAGALHYHANALTDAMIDRRNAQGGDDGDAYEEWSGDSAPAATTPARKPRVVKPSSVARLEALRGEFSDDPEGISFILSFLHVLDKDPEAILDALEHNVAQAPTDAAPQTPAA